MAFMSGLDLQSSIGKSALEHAEGVNLQTVLY